MANVKEKGKGLWAEFKAFITRGNVVDMSVGVVMGSAFSAIVTAFTNILLSLCTWAVPGGLKGFVTVLPAISDAQKGLDPDLGLGQFFATSDLQALAKAEAEKLYDDVVVAANPNLIESVKSTILSKYTIHGTKYTYNLSATLDWGTFINAIISFLIVAATLFVVVKVFASLTKARENFETSLKSKMAKPEPAAEPTEEAK